MSESLIGVGHPVSFVFFTDGGPAVIGGIEDLVGEFIDHGFFRPFTSELNDPTECESVTALLANFDGDLVSGPTDTTGANFDGGPDVFDGLTEDPDSFIGAGFGLNSGECMVHDAFSDGLFAIFHHTVNELGDEDVFELRVGEDVTFSNFSSSRHRRLRNGDYKVRKSARAT